MKYADTYSKLADFGRELLNKTSLAEGLPHISKYAKDVIKAERCSIFIYDLQKHELWTTIADGVEKIVVPSDKGIVGYTLKIRKPVIANDAYSNPNFLSDVDKKTGYKTENLVAAPIFNSKREIIGVLELLNKEDGFDDEDVKFMIFFAHYVSGFLELVNLYKAEDEKDKRVDYNEKI
ncbi:GAF domain-containing protein [bacterium]|nr:GAF domain-containing protein [bacterium]MBU1993705.1 GAF domain-containing protein [bacterium]